MEAKQIKEVKVLQNVLAANDAIAAENARLFEEKNIYVLNVMASPGAGKTSFILETIKGLKPEVEIAVIEGDIASKVDAEKVQEHQVPAVQINTGGACHLDANMIKNAFSLLDADNIRLLIIENVGNLVCPAEFKLGETRKLMILSVPEGDDKPLKYPLMFSEADVLIVNKIDLLSMTNFGMERLKETTLGINPDLKIFELSCVTGEGVGEWLSWIRGELTQ